MQSLEDKPAKPERNRLLWRCLIAGGLGFTLPLVVAWMMPIAGNSWIRSRQGDFVQIVGRQGRSWRAPARTRFSVRPEVGHESDPVVRIPLGLEQFVRENEYCALWSYGWPLRCVSGGTSAERAWPVGFENYKLRDMIVLVEGSSTETNRAPPDRNGAWIIPTRISIWPYLVNAITYFGVLFLVLVGPNAIRRYIRRRSGLCSQCGYDVSSANEHSCCPECGASMSGTKSSHARSSPHARSES